MRVAVTGASGFVGRHVVRELLARGIETIALSRSIPRDFEGQCQWVLRDIGAERSADELVQRGASALIHLAWGGLPNYNSEYHLASELPRQSAFLRQCIDAGIGHMLVAGTCLEYGLQEGAMVESAPLRPVTHYGVAKKMLLEELLTLQSRSHFVMTWPRLFYLYGPGQSSISLRSQLWQACQANAGIFPMSAGDQRRDFIAVEQAASLVVDLLLAKASCGPVNIGCGVGTSVADMVAKWLNEWDCTMSLQPGVYPYPSYEPFAFWADVSKLKSILRAA